MEETSDVASSCNGFNMSELPVMIVMNRKSFNFPYFVCQLPEHPQLCYKFKLLRTNKLANGSVEFSLVCSHCLRLKYPIPSTYTAVSIKGRLCLLHPLSNHLPECTPSDFEATLTANALVAEPLREIITRGGSISEYLQSRDDPFEGEEISGKWSRSPNQFPVELALNSLKNHKVQYVICRMRENPMKCYKFVLISRKEIPSGVEFTAICNKCCFLKKYSTRGKGAPRYIVRKMKDNVLLILSPMDNHLPSCIPDDYDSTIEEHPIVREEVKQKIINGEPFDLYLPPLGQPFANAEPATGGSGSGDPATKGLTDKPAWSSSLPRELAPEDSNYPVIICIRENRAYKGQPTFVYRLPDKPAKCYSFKIDFRISAGFQLEGQLRLPLRCASCLSRKVEEPMDELNRYNIEAKFMTDGRKLLSSPFVGHLEGCQPFSYAKTIMRSPEASEEVKERVLKGEVTISPDRRRSRVDLDDDDDDPIREVADGSRRKRKADSSGGTACSSSSISHPIDHGSNSAASIPPSTPSAAGSSVSIESVCVKTEVVPSPYAVPNSAISPPPPYDSPTPEPVRRIQLSVPKKFEKKFDAFIFTEEEVAISVDGNVLRVQFERKSSIGSSRSSHHLLYEHDLPNYVIKDSFSTSWESGQLVVSANTTST